MKKSYEAQQTLIGHYGLAHAGDVIELPEDQAKPLLEAGVIKETGKGVTHAERDVEAEDKSKPTVTITHNAKEKKEVKAPKEKKVIKKPGS